MFCTLCKQDSKPAKFPKGDPLYVHTLQPDSRGHLLLVQVTLVKCSGCDEYISIEQRVFPIFNPAADV